MFTRKVLKDALVHVLTEDGWRSYYTDSKGAVEIGGMSFPVRRDHDGGLYLKPVREMRIPVVFSDHN